MRHTPALWIHASRNIVLVLAVDSFGVKYTNRPDAEHLKNALQIVYSMTTDWKGLKKMWLTLKWEDIKITVAMYMVNYVPSALHKFHNKAPGKPQDAPHRFYRPTYVQVTQHENPEDSSPLLPPEKISLVQKIDGTFLYYKLAVNNTILVFLSDLASKQAKVN